MAGLPKPEELLPHRGIAQALDEITELEPGKSAVGLWTPDERYFEGHFPQESFLPGHWQTESVALVGACALLAKMPNLLPLFRESQSKYKGQVKPGDTLEMEAEFLEVKEIEHAGAKMLLASGKGQAKVDGKVVYQASMLKAVAETK